VLTFTDQQAGEQPQDAVRRAIDDHIPGAACDVGVHAVIWDPPQLLPGSIERLAKLGVTSIKVWLAYEELGIMISDGRLYDILREAAAAGVLVLAHCENGGALVAYQRVLVANGGTALASFASTRPPELEAEAIHRLLALAWLARARVYVVHVSGAEPLDEMRRAKRRGQTCFAEACTHHLALADDCYHDDDGLLYTVVPPLRGERDVQALWEGVSDRTIDVLSSDHSSLTRADKLVNASDDFRLLRVGLPGLQLRLAVAFTTGVVGGRIPIGRLIEVACEAPARATGIYPRKGALLPGSDADVVVWDPDAPAAPAQDADFTPYAHLSLRGRPRSVLVGGEVVVSDGIYLDVASRGRFLRRTADGTTEA
jgi:dihydropyrimidinase